MSMGNPNMAVLRTTGNPALYGTNRTALDLGSHLLAHGGTAMTEQVDQHEQYDTDEPAVSPFPEWLVALGGAMLAIGAFLPWITARTPFGSISRNGLEDGGDGIVTLVLGGVIAAVGIGYALRSLAPRVWFDLLAGLAGLAALAVAIYDIAEVNDRASGAESDMVSVSVGSGLVVSVIGALVVLGSMLVVRARR